MLQRRVDAPQQGDRKGMYDCRFRDWLPKVSMLRLAIVLCDSLLQQGPPASFDER